ncbi:hypothetical protein AJ80_09113 [Polytolypa hystricis UAMH7299]|uniref:Zn(2)-C6 fungal-type domain-containing protein n=1 Tax=Polytolypa hystricis (strain UAMH7299) TaxID=1447883 RepID=A0A2B7WWJ3_POLH7|nr:hypothetical protein AJ80_09113 [Polytolypa hystricis UAMH7299]
MEKRVAGGRMSSAAAEPGKSKYRAKQSCIPCRTRKVKCDRIKPCQACCVRGLPSECEYVTTNEDRFLITQADAIDSLRNEVTRLKQQLADLENIKNMKGARDVNDKNNNHYGPQSSPQTSTPPGVDLALYEKYVLMESIVNVIASAPPEIVADTVAQVRKGASLETIALLANQSPEVLMEITDTGWNSAATLHTPSSSCSNSNNGGFLNDLPYTPPKSSITSDYSYGVPSTNMSSVSPFAAPVTTMPYTPTTGAPSVMNGSIISDAMEDGYTDPKVTPDLTEDQPMSDEEDISPGPLAARVSEKYAVVEALLDRFVDAFSPEVGSGNGASTTIRSAAGIRMFSPLLSDAFRAVSTTYFGQSMSQKNMEISGYKDYLTVLRDLQHALYDPVQSTAQGTLLTVALLMCFEALQRTTPGSVMNHGLGVLRLLEFRGPHKHMFGIEHLCFTELRPYWVCITVLTRVPTFLAREEWKTIPWSAGSSVKDIMHHLLDQVVEIPALLSQFDRFMEGLNSGYMEYTDVAPMQKVLWTWLADINQRLCQWKTTWADHYPGGQVTEALPQGADGFPVFQCRDPATMEVITPTILVYPDLRIAHSLCIYYSARLILATVDTRPTDAVQPQEQFEFACNICRSIEYFVRNSPGSVVNRLAFPLRVAYDALPEGNIERDYVATIFHLVERKFNLRLWGSMIPEISTRTKLLS